MAKLTLPIHTNRRGQSIQTNLINCFAEKSAQGAKGPITLLGSPGVSALGSLGSGPYRGHAVYDGVLYAVGGASLYRIAADGTVTTVDPVGGSKIGTDATGIPITGKGRVSMAANRDALSIYTSDKDYTVTNDVITEITDTDKQAATLVDVIEGYAVHIRSGTDEIAASGLANSGVFDGLDFEAVASEPDLLVSLITDGTKLVLFGQNTTEFYWVQSTGGFPLARIPNGVMQRGCIAPFSPVKMNQGLFWLDEDRVPRQLSGIQGVRISSHAIDNDLSKVTDPTAITAFSYQVDGHYMYCLTTDKGTYCFDQSSGEWHERRSLGLNRWRVDDIAHVYNKQIAFDSESNQFGVIDSSIATEFGDPIRMEWTYPTVYAEGRTASHKRLETMASVGEIRTDSDPLIGLLVSDDGGKTFDEMDTRSLGKTGNYNQTAVWHNLGSSDNRVYRHFISDPVRRFVADTQLEVTGGRM